jgi:ribulose-5-phosphate 4-epimerase/fuculose-1-phosphate aldolase
MEQLIKKYSEKLFHHGLTEKNAALLGSRDADIVWNKKDKIQDKLNKIFKELNIQSLLFAEPKEPYRTIINFLTDTFKNTIMPKDCETRTFLHDLPVVDHFDIKAIIEILKKRKSVIIANQGIITTGTVSPEQTFLVYSSVCFACFVKYFSDYLKSKKNNSITVNQKLSFKKILAHLEEYPKLAPALMDGPFLNEEKVYQAMDEAGKLTVDYKLVDSYFGNISYLLDNQLFISQTSSSLDELNGHIDPCPLDNTSCAGLTASSELTAHKKIVMETENLAILHGHPKFSVILSMDCDEKNCKHKDQCHIKCEKDRLIDDIPIVSGEVGTGPTGLCHTMPEAIKDNRGTIVYGHGLFTTGKIDFNEAFKNLLDIEKMCRNEFFKLIL